MPRTPDPKLLSTRVLVEINVDALTKVPRAVWQHELPILDAIYGEGTVKRLEPETIDEGYSPKVAREMLIWNKTQDPIPKPSVAARLGWVFFGSAAVEYERLAGAYGMHREVRQSWVENVYGRFADGKLTALLGTPTLADLPEGQLRALVRDYGGSDAQVAAKAEDLPKVAAELGVEVS